MSLKRKIDGRQAPEINDGGVVTQVDLASQDGLILTNSETAVFLPNVVKARTE